MICFTRNLLFTTLVIGVYGNAATAVAAGKASVIQEAAESARHMIGGKLVRQTSSKVDDTVARYGDDAAQAIDKIGPGAWEVIEQAGPHAEEAIRLMARHGDAAV